MIGGIGGDGESRWEYFRNVVAVPSIKQTGGALRCGNYAYMQRQLSVSLILSAAVTNCWDPLLACSHNLDLSVMTPDVLSTTRVCVGNAICCPDMLKNRFLTCLHSAQCFDLSAVQAEGSLEDWSETSMFLQKFLLLAKPEASA